MEKKWKIKGELGLYEGLPELCDEACGYILL